MEQNGTTTPLSPVLLPERPKTPNENSCCGNGCTPCVFDIHEKEVLIWERECLALKQGKETLISTNPKLSTEEYTLYKLIAIVPDEATDVFIYRFCIPEFQSLELGLGQHLIIRCYDGTHPISRQYSPITPLHNAGSFDLLIKIYPEGKMSQIIRNWTVGTMVDFRGPFHDFIYNENMLDKLYIVCMGTGIAPMVPIITSILENENDEVMVKLIYGCSSYSETLLKKQLNEWSLYWNFSVIYCFSRDENNDHYGKKIYKERISPSVLDKEIELTKKYKILICGSASFSEGMMEYMNNLSIPSSNIHLF